MTLTNHLLTGAALAKFLPLPVAIPLAFASHFVLDASPHFGFSKEVDWSHRQKKVWRYTIALDFLAASIVSIWLISTGHVTWFVTGLVAYSPDAIWIYRYVFEEKWGTLPYTKGNKFIQFHRNLQKYERWWGFVIEIAYAGVMILILQ